MLVMLALNNLRTKTRRDEIIIRKSGQNETRSLWIRLRLLAYDTENHNPNACEYRKDVLTFSVRLMFRDDMCARARSMKGG